MADREKVIKALRCRAFNDQVPCEDCAYFRPDHKPIPKCDWDQIFEDTIELLKEQEPVELKPHYIDLYSKHFICGVECGNCGIEISAKYKYCPYCGRGVKWE